MRRVRFIIFTSPSFHEGKPVEISHMIETGQEYLDFGECVSIVREDGDVFRCFFSNDNEYIVKDVKRYYIETVCLKEDTNQESI